MVERSWHEVLATHYGHHPVTAVDQMKCHSLHFIYRWRNRKYVLSKVHKDDQRVPFPHQFALTGFLSGRTGIVQPAHPPVARDTAPWIEHPSHYWFVRAFTDHDPSPDWNEPRLIEDWATKLADLHEIMEDHRHPVERPPESLAPYHWPLRTVLHRLDEFVDDLAKRPRAEQDLTHVRRGLERLADEATELDLGPIGMTHQDLSPGNILVRDGEVVAVIDWDRAQRDHCLYDAVLAALHLARCQPAADRTEAAGRFIKAYKPKWNVDDNAIGWMFRYAVLRNLAVSHTPERWRRLQPDVELRWGGY